MVEKQRNERPRGRYFLDRRDFVRRAPAPTPAPRSIEKPDRVLEDDPEIESKLKSLYDSLNTSFWDTEPKKRKEKKKKAAKEPKVKTSDLRSRISDSFSGLKAAVANSSFKDLAKQKKIAFPAVGLVAVLAMVVVFGGGDSKKSGSIATVKGTSTVNLDKTPYKPLLPKADEKGETARSSLNFEPQKKVFTFNDSVNNGKGVIVSQQPMPEDYKSDPISGLTAIASNIGASDWVASSRGKVFYGNNEKGEGIIAVFTYKDILVIMRTSAHITESELQKYVDKLEPS